MYGMLWKTSTLNLAVHAGIASSLQSPWLKLYSPLVPRFLIFTLCKLCTTSIPPSIGVGFVFLDLFDRAANSPAFEAKIGLPPAFFRKPAGGMMLFLYFKIVVSVVLLIK